MDQVKEQCLLFMDEVESRELHQIEQSLAEIQILHDDFPYLSYDTMRQVVHALGHVLRVLMNVMDGGERELLRDILFEDNTVMPSSISLTIRTHSGDRMDRCLFVRGMARFEFKYREFHDNAFHVGRIGDPLNSFQLMDTRSIMHVTSNDFLICYCSFFTTLI